MKIRIATVVALAAAVTTLTACGSSSSQNAATTPAPTSVAATDHNDADSAFATEMIPHHAQAVQMADLALDYATNADLKAMATKIKADQAPEITTMTGWLTAWGEPVPKTSASMGGMNAMGYSGHAMGMMSDAQMMTLGNMIGVNFDRMWIRMMIAHHQGAIDMSKAELTSGQYTGAKALAQSIITSQTTQITQLRAISG